MGKRSRLKVESLPAHELLDGGVDNALRLYTLLRSRTRSPLEALMALELARYLVQDSLPPNVRHHTLIQLTELEQHIQDARAELARLNGTEPEPAAKLAVCLVCRKALCTCSQTEPG